MFRSPLNIELVAFRSAAADVRSARKNAPSSGNQSAARMERLSSVLRLPVLPKIDD
jgi:hypothetical protein